jgi:hypothetical protein
MIGVRGLTRLTASCCNCSTSAPKRTTEVPAILAYRVLHPLDISSRIPLAISRPFRGLRFISTTDPTDKIGGLCPLWRTRSSRLFGRITLKMRAHTQTELLLIVNTQLTSHETILSAPDDLRRGLGCSLERTGRKLAIRPLMHHAPFARPHSSCNSSRLTLKLAGSPSRTPC